MSELVSAVIVSGADSDPGQRQHTLNSVRQQTYPQDAMQVIVAGRGLGDDVAGDGVEVLNVSAPSEGAAMNCALEAVRGTLLLWSDAATEWDAQRVEHTVAFFEANPEADVCLGPLTHGEHDCTRLDRWDTYGERIAVFLAVPCPLGAIAMRRRVVDLLKRCREIDLSRWELLMRCSLTGRPIGRLDTPLGQRLAPCDATQPGITAGRSPHTFIKEHLEDLGSKDLFNHVTLRSVSDAYCIKAALFGLHDFVTDGLVALAEADRVGRTGNGLYWHGILRRRLGDLPGAEQHFAKLGAHPVLAAMRGVATELLADPVDPDLRLLYQATTAADDWNPLAFVELCRKCIQGKASPEAEQVARCIQTREFDLLFGHTYRAALREV